MDRRCTPEGIDAPWLNEVFTANGVARGATVMAVEFLGYIGTGQTGSNGRFALTWDEPADRPASVVAKFPSSDPDARVTAFANGAYLREWNFYAQIAATVAMRTPRVHASHFDMDGQHFVLLMDDIVGAEQGDQIAGLTLDDASLAVAEAVQLHAPRWADPALSALLGGGLSVDERSFGLGMAYAATRDGFLARLGHRLDPEVVEFVQALTPLVPAWVKGLGAPNTVVHMDYRPDNLMFGRRPGAAPIVVVDWQTVSDGPALTDVAYLLGGSFEPARRAEVEHGLIEMYQERLAATGVTYSFDECWRDYRLGSVWGVVMTVIATMYAAETERGNDMLVAMANRHGHHALDLDATELLR